jgi:hypothetical protein
MAQSRFYKHSFDKCENGHLFETITQPLFSVISDDASDSYEWSDNNDHFLFPSAFFKIK